MAWRLELNELRCHVRLGHGAAERSQPQEIDVSVRLEGEALPAACGSDALEDTLCYAELSAEIRGVCGEREYRLIEHLTARIHDRLGERLRKPFSRLTVSVHKLRPPVDGLRGGARFEITA